MACGEAPLIHCTAIYYTCMPSSWHRTPAEGRGIIGACTLAPALQVGGVIEVFSRGFELLDADIATLKYVESEASEDPTRMPWGDYDTVLAKLRRAVAAGAPSAPALRAVLAACEAAGDGSGYIPKDDLYVSVWRLFGDAAVCMASAAALKSVWRMWAGAARLPERHGGHVGGRGPHTCSFGIHLGLPVTIMACHWPPHVKAVAANLASFTATAAHCLCLCRPHWLTSCTAR